MIISQAELERRIKSENNLTNQLQLEVRPAAEKPKRDYTPRVQDKQVRVLAGTLAHLDTTANVARELGLTPQQVSSAAHSKDKSVKDAVDATRDRVSELALTQLMGALDLLGADTLVGEKPKDLAIIAASLSRVHANLTPRDSGSAGPGLAVILYAPEQKPEGRYKVLDV